MERVDIGLGDIQVLQNGSQTSPVCGLFDACPRKGGCNHPADSLIIELELRRKKSERVARDETMRLVYKLKVLGQPVTSEVRSKQKVTKSVAQYGL